MEQALDSLTVQIQTDLHVMTAFLRTTDLHLTTQQRHQGDENPIARDNKTTTKSITT